MTKYPTVLIPVCPDLEHLSEEGLRQMAKGLSYWYIFHSEINGYIQC